MLTDLLFYEATSRTGEFYATDGLGGISLLRQHTGWRSSWTQIILGNFGGSGFTDLLFYEAASGTGEFYATDGSGGISLLRQHTGWRSSWTQIIPGNFGPSTGIRLHIKILAAPNIAIDTMVNSMREVYVPAGFRIIIGSTENLNLPLLQVVDTRNPNNLTDFCRNGLITNDQQQLFQNRNNVGTNDIVVYFVLATIPPLNGCAAHPAGMPGAIVVQGATQWTLAHEIGHVLGLDHVNDRNRLMTGNGTANITNPPPDLIASEITTMDASPLTINI